MEKNISIKKLSENDDQWEFEVSIDDDDGETMHRISLNKSYYESLTGGDALPDAFVKKCFTFLLKREPKELIMEEFDISEINDFFPEFEDEISG